MAIRELGNPLGNQLVLPRSANGISLPFDVRRDAKILNQSFITISEGATSVGIGFTPINPRAVFFEFIAIPTTDNWTAGGPFTCQLPIAGDLDYNNAAQAYKKLAFSISGNALYLNGSSIVFFSSFAGVVYIKVTEYDIDVLFREKIYWAAQSAPYPNYNLVNTITNIKNVYIDAHSGSPSTSLASVGGFCDSFLNDSNSRIHCIDDNARVFLKDNKTLSMLDPTGAGFGLIVVTEFKKRV